MPPRRGRGGSPGEKVPFNCRLTAPAPFDKRGLLVYVKQFRTSRAME